MATSIKVELNKYLKELNKAELEKEVKKLYSKFNDVKLFYKMELSANSSEVLHGFKERIKKEYYPSRGFGRGRNRESKKVITEFKKIAIHKKDVVELLLYRVEMMMSYTNDYGDIDEPFYNSMENSFEEACKMVRDERLEEEYREKCRELMDNTYPLGWGVYDGFLSIYDTYIGNI